VAPDTIDFTGSGIASDETYGVFELIEVITDVKVRAVGFIPMRGTVSAGEYPDASP